MPAGRVPVDWRRVRRPLTLVCFTLSLLGAVAASLGSMVAGRLAEHATSTLVALLALCVVGGALIDTAAKVIWAAVCDRAEGRLRADLLDAAMAQPLSELSEQAVGEVLDRIDDDTWEVGQLMRWGVWQAVRTLLASGPLWVVATVAWWPAAFLFPLTGFATYWVVRRLLPQVAERKVVEEAAWTDHAASTEEGVAARDDLRTALGQAARAAPQRPDGRAGPCGARQGSSGRGPDHPAQRRTAPRRAGRRRGRRHRPRARRRPVDRPAGHPLPGHDDVRRRRRHAGASPARPAGGLRRGPAAARHARLSGGADRRAATARRTARRGVPRARVQLWHWHVRAP